MKMRTVELIGPALDWAVASYEGKAREQYTACTSTCWAAGGPILEREKISIEPTNGQWYAEQFDSTDGQYGPTPLIAAMRCLVAAKLGDEVDVPKELL